MHAADESVLQQLPYVKTITIVLIGFLGETNPTNKTTTPDEGKPSDGLFQEASDGDRVVRLICYNGLCEEVIEKYQLEPPTVAVIAHPYLHSYFNTWHPTIQWLIQRKTPTVVIGGSAPDYSEKEGEKLLEALGCTLRVKMTPNPFLISLIDNSEVSKLHHVFVFRGGPGLDKSNLTTTKIQLIAADLHVS